MSEELEIYDQRRIVGELYQDQYVALSNALIQAREKTSLLESKIELLAIYRMNDNMKVKVKKDSRGKKHEIHYVEINSSEIKNLIDRKGHSLYEQIESAAYELKSKLYIYRDSAHGQFRMDNLYGEVAYDHGLLTIEFNPFTEFLFSELKESYTRINLAVAFSFKKNGSLQLYKLLKSYVYVLPQPDPELLQEEQEALTKTYSLSELRLQLGYVDLNQAEVQKEGAKPFPDSEKMAAAEKKPKYKKWYDFYNRVLAPGIKEINEISDIYIESIEKTSGAHNRVDGVTIRFMHNRDYYLGNAQSAAKAAQKKKRNENKKPTEEEFEYLADKLQEALPGTVKMRDIRSICEAAGYDEQLIDQAIAVLNSQSSKVENAVGFILKAIQGNWKTADSGKRKPEKNTFTDIENNEYDFDELEKELMEN